MHQNINSQQNVQLVCRSYCEMLTSGQLDSLYIEPQVDIISSRLILDEHGQMQDYQHTAAAHQHRAQYNQLTDIHSPQFSSVLRHPQKHQCSQCYVPLKYITKIFAMPKSDFDCSSTSKKELRILCVPCFAGWSTSKMDPNQIPKVDYKIWLSRGLNKKIEVDESQEISIADCLQIFSCAQKYGPHVNSRFQRQFFQRTGNNLPQSEIQEVYLKVRGYLFQAERQLTFDYSQADRQYFKFQQVNQIPRSLSIVQDLHLKRQEEVNEAQLFFSLLQYRNPVQKFRKYPDNHSDFLFRAFSTNEIAKKLVSGDKSKNLETINKKTTLIYCLSQYSAQKNQIESFHNSLSKKYCEKYVQMKRGAKPEIPIQDRDNKLLHELTHPQVSGLMKDKQLNGILGKIVKLNKQREEILKEVGQKKKSMESRRRSERRQTRRSNKSMDMQIQSEQQGSRDENEVRRQQIEDEEQEN